MSQEGKSQPRWILRRSRQAASQLSAGDDDYGGNINVYDTSKIFFRPIIAYHFYQRSTFEKVPDRVLVKRVQIFLASLGIPMPYTDVAQMLQYAADESKLIFLLVPLNKAVETYLRDYVQKIRQSEAVAKDYGDGLSTDTCILFNNLQKNKVNGGPVDRSKLEEIFKEVFKEINKERETAGSNPWEKSRLETMESVFNNDENMELFMKRCSEPLVRNSTRDNYVATALELLIDN
ncbi:unnamed protein product [Fusarium venenatum]|uniref:Uncharacterized protein n=1 Tax=Fusarium venenatum TaxID=56646 RepID=A0A2L2T5M2_9HYPO|nr:uncharacterized protein FVRRES_04767 [Fusarium venenatum]KAH6991917.1 hypothetical protein EDB82DRAFT_553805 [Fusarium venenatum]CEI60331.1 unnamed protein product [Fusarium venenatum]